MMIDPIYELCKGVLSAAKNGQKLPILTIVFILQILHLLHSLHYSSHVSNENESSTSTSTSTTINNNYPIIILPFTVTLPILLIIINIFTFLLPGYTILYQLYKHSITTIFNKKLSSLTYTQCIPSYNMHLMLLKPLDVLFRYLTLRFRVLPDIIVLGEVRCGTTSFCQHLATVLKEDDDEDDDDGNGNDDERYQVFLDCQTPFCLWKHPELDHKETFYFVGHYLGMVTPKYYRMCFPLQITQSWNQLRYYLQHIFQKKRNNNNNKTKRTKRKKPLLITFDGCAQYMTSPTAPYLIAEAYKLANQSPPILISCVRDPIEQTNSWWKYENNAMQWGESLGLKEWNHELRSVDYPPRTIQDALKFTQSDFVKDGYDRAERLFSLESLEQMRNENSKQHVYLPPWAMSWPGGQLTGIGRNGHFIKNINRFEKVFREAFDHHDDDNGNGNGNGNEKKNDTYGTMNTNATTNNISESSDSTFNKLKYINVLPLAYLSNEKLLKSFMVTILQKAALRRKDTRERQDFEKGIRYFQQSKRKISNVHRNASSSSGQQQSKMKAFDDTIDALEQYFALEKKALDDMISPAVKTREE